MYSKLNNLEYELIGRTSPIDTTNSNIIKYKTPLEDEKGTHDSRYNTINASNKEYNKYSRQFSSSGDNGIVNRDGIFTMKPNLTTEIVRQRDLFVERPLTYSTSSQQFDMLNVKTRSNSRMPSFMSGNPAPITKFKIYKAPTFKGTRKMKN